MIAGIASRSSTIRPVRVQNHFELFFVHGDVCLQNQEIHTNFVVLDPCVEQLTTLETELVPLSAIRAGLLSEVDRFVAARAPLAAPKLTSTVDYRGSLGLSIVRHIPVTIQTRLIPTYHCEITSNH